jgi:hypothetical protein
VTTFCFGWVAEAQFVEQKVECGNIVRGTYANAQEYHDYLINLNSGWVLKVKPVPVGGYLGFRAMVYDPVGREIFHSGREINKVSQIGTDRLSATGQYRLRLWNHDQSTYGNNWNGGAGDYDLHVGCIRADGTEVTAGGTSPQVQPQTGLETSPAPDGVVELQQIGNVLEGATGKAGFLDGLSETTQEVVQAAGEVGKLVSTFRQIHSLFPKKNKKRQLQQQRLALPAQPLVHPEQAVAAPTPPASPASPLPLRAPMMILPKLHLPVQLSGGLSTSADSPFGFQFPGQEGAQVELKLTRLSGSLYMTVQVLAAGDQAIFQNTLLANNELTSNLLLPVAGDFTVKVEPAQFGGTSQASDATFQIQITAK